jgi:prolyl-tRNA synthetase
MRGREFLMKDAYSFHAEAGSLDATYQDMLAAYRRIFEACGLDYTVVEADTGTIGGSSSHELMVVAETGESAVVRCPSCGYAANVEKAETRGLDAPPAEPERPFEVVETPGQHTVEEVTAFLGVPPERLVKTLIYETEKGLVAVAVRGDRSINEVKLGNFLDVQFLALAGEEKVRVATGAPVGFVGPVGLPKELRLIADRSAAAVEGFVCGANRADAHLTGVRWGRDAAPEAVADLLEVTGGDPCPRCDGNLELFRGIETGHIFKLGTKYSEKMSCVFADENGADLPMIMGCYGLGIGRTVAAAVEQNHDDSGIVWPLPLAPFHVLLVSLNAAKDDAVRAAADQLYDRLVAAGVEVLYDDRDERPGVKFNDADLIGIPIRVVAGAKSLAEGKVEVSLRRDKERVLLTADEAVARVVELVRG